MTDPRRLLDEGATPVERALLAAGATEEPSADEMHRAAAALGIAAGVGAGLPGTASAATAASGGVPTLLKWLGAALLVSGGVGVGAYRLTADPGQGVSSTSQRQAAPSGEVRSVHGAEGLAAPSVSAERAGESEPAELAVAGGPERSGAERGRARSGAAHHVDRAASIRSQTALIDEARRELRGGNAAGALAVLDRYQRRFPRGVFGQEAVLLRIEALVRRGSRAEARALARRFLADRPSSQYASRIEGLVGPMGSQANSGAPGR